MRPMVIINPPRSDGQESSWKPSHATPSHTPQPYHSFDGVADVAIKPVITSQIHVDYGVLLLVLADQYISAARKIAPLIAHNQEGVDIAKYHELVSASLRCLECCLRHPNFSHRPPRQEAALQLKYACLLFEETVDYGDIEELLSKSMLFCERNRLLDLKYSMHHLLIRVLSKNSVSAAVKQADHVLSECERLAFVPWIYAFLLMKASLLLQVRSTRNNHATLVALRRLMDLGRSRNDAQVVIASALMQAAILLRLRKDDSVLEARAALAMARALLSNYTPQDLPQLYVLAYQLELACCLDPYDYQQAQSALQALKRLMDTQLSGTQWRRDRACYLCFNMAGFESVLFETGGLFVNVAARDAGLAFSWLGRVEAYTLGLVLSGITIFQRNARDGNSGALLKEALTATGDDKAIQDAPDNLPLSLACQKVISGRVTRALVLLQLAFAFCSRTDWNAAHNVLQRAQRLLSSLPGQDYLGAAARYLQAMISQGCGHLDAALSLYRTLWLTLDMRESTSLSTTEIIGILAALNALLMVSRPSHPNHDLVPTLCEKLGVYFPTTGSSIASRYPDLVSAHALITAVLHQTQDSKPLAESKVGSEKITKNVVASKQALQTALNASKRANNALLKALCLSYMHHVFFGGIVDDQALRIAQGGVIQAREAGNQIWVDIAEAKLAQIEGQRAGTGSG